MAHRRLNAIWAKYIISPNPLSGAPSLHDTCLALTKHSLQLTDIVGFGAGFKLHPDLAQQVSEVCAAMDSLLRPAARHHFGESSFYIGSDLPYVLTGFLGERLRAQQWQIISHWVMLLDRLEFGMQELRNLCLGDPHARTHRDRPSPYPRLVASLSPILQVRLRPCDFELWGMAVPLTVREKAEFARTMPIEPQLPASETHSVISAVSPPRRSSPPMAAPETPITTTTGSETAVADSGCGSAPLSIDKCDAAAVRERTIACMPIAAVPAAVKDPPCNPVISPPGVGDDTDSSLAPQESAMAPRTLRAVLCATDSAPLERSSRVRDAGEHVDADIGLRGIGCCSTSRRERSSVHRREWGDDRKSKSVSKADPGLEKIDDTHPSDAWHRARARGMRS